MYVYSSRFTGQHIMLFFLLGTLLISCQNDLKKISETVNKSKLNDERGEEVTIIYSTGGNTKARLSAPVFEHQQSKEPFFFEMKKGLRVEFFNDSLKPESILTARYGKYFEKEGNMEVRDSVVVTNSKKEQLNTEQLIWSEKDQKFRSNKFVKITTPTQIIYGDGLESNQNFTEYKILNVKGIIGVEQGVLPL